MENNKKLIGYKLKDEKYKPLFKALVASETRLDEAWRPYNNTIAFQQFSGAKDLAESFNVLDAWFDPVYREETLPVDRWYKDVDGDLFYVKEWSEERYGNPVAFGYGFVTGSWCTAEEGNEYPFTGTPVPATDKEVEEALTKEAERRGYAVGVETEYGEIKKCDFLGQAYSHEIGNGGKNFHFNNILAFKNGEWTPIVKGKLPEIGCYKGEITDRHIKYGCRNLSKKTLKAMEQVGILEVTLMVNGDSVHVGADSLEAIYKAAHE